MVLFIGGIEISLNGYLSANPLTDYWIDNIPMFVNLENFVNLVDFTPP